MGILVKLAACASPMVVALMLLASPLSASAQASRTWVSGVGDDANPCSRTAPCKTFAGAISKTAANGEINCIDSGGFGGVTIVKSIVIDCKGTLAGVLNAGANGVIVNSASAQVILRNLSIDGFGTGLTGIRVLAAASVHVEDVIIRGQSAHGIEFAPSGNSQLTVVRSTVRESAQHGVLVAPTGGAVARVSVSESVLSGNGLTGIRVNDGGNAALTDTVLSGNATHGATAASAGGAVRIALERVLSAQNGNGGVLASGANAVVYLSHTFLTGNAYGLYPSMGGSYVSFGNNRTSGNSISDGSPTSVVSQF